VSVQQHSGASAGPTTGADAALIEQLDALAGAYGNRKTGTGS